MNVEIPKGRMAEDDPKPCWIPTQDSEGRPLKPVIRCRCGRLQGIGLHHVHADGRVTASFFHAAAHELQKDAQGYFFNHNGKRYSAEPGCGWHVFLKLKDYDCGDFSGEE